MRYSSEKQARFYGDLMTRLSSLPGVQSASAVLPLPLSGDRISISFQIDGRPVARKDEPSADMFVTEPNYFRTMGILIIKGRDFEQRDEHKSTPVIIVTESFARQYFPGEDAIGKRIKPGISTYDEDKSEMREISRAGNNAAHPVCGDVECSPGGVAPAACCGAGGLCIPA